MRKFILGPKKSSLAKALVAAERTSEGYDIIAFQVMVADEEVVDKSMTPWPQAWHRSYQIVMMYDAELRVE